MYNSNYLFLMTFVHVFLTKPLLNMDLDNAKSELATREFIAVVLAGFGNEYVLSSSRKLVVNLWNQTSSTYKRLWR
jgi:hypothetical protein